MMDLNEKTIPVELSTELNAARRCGSCRSWDPIARRCCDSKSPLFRVLSVHRYETCDVWADLRNLYMQRDVE